jgi:formylglycine-generating enzyme required for sulfatase activity
MEPDVDVFRIMSRGASPRWAAATGGVLAVLGLPFPLACGRVELGSLGTADAGLGAGSGLGGAPASAAPDASSSIDAGRSIDAGPLPPTGEPPSCRSATERCGPTSDSCCLSPSVTGGAVSLPLAPLALERVAANVSSFRLDKYEVTIGRFREFIAGYDAWRGLDNPLPGAGAHPELPDSGWSSAFDASLPASAAELERDVRSCNTVPLSTLDIPNGASRAPLNCVTWFEAAAFCAWDDARLPTYAEWYYAAAGGALDRTYPWGDEPTPSRAYALFGCTLGMERPECTASYVLPVGSHPNGAGLFEQHDLAGSMTEWLIDSASSVVTQGCSTDCVTVSDADGRYWGGGSWLDNETNLTNENAAIIDPTWRMPFVGLRCARNEP